MMKRIFPVAALMISSHLLAQDTTHVLDQVTVTASKFSVKTSETGKVVTLITRQDLEHAGSRDLSQVITELGGVFINGYNSNAGKDKSIYLRGAKVEYTLITIDGVPVYDASGIGSNFDIRNISVDNVERIEILKGSQSTLYGSDAIAGVINIITKKGAGKPLTFSGTAQYGSFDSRRANADLSGKSGMIDYNLGFSHFHTEGYSEARQPQGATVPFDRDAYTQNSVQANLGVQVKQWRVQPFLRYSHIKADLDQDAFTDERDYTSTSKNLQAGLRNQIHFKKSDLNFLYQYTKTRRAYLDDSTGSRNGYYVYHSQKLNAGEHFGEAFLVTRLSNVKLTVGADLRSSRNDVDEYSVTPAFPPFVPFPEKTAYQQDGDSIHQHQESIYAAVNTALHALSLEAGARYNHHSEYGSNFAYNLNPSYRIGQKVKLFANYSTGYRTPSLYQLFSVYGNRNLQPETSRTLEGGFQYFGKNEKWTLRASYFNRRIDDAIAFFYNASTFVSQYINQDKQRDHGIDAELSVRPSSKTQFKLLFNFVDGDITTKVAGKDTTYFNLLRRPRHTWNVFLGQQVTRAFYSSLQLNIVGKRNDVYFDPNTFKSRTEILPPYALLNFYAEYALLKNKLKVFADLRNILDADYSDIYGYNTAGFNGYGGLRFQF